MMNIIPLNELSNIIKKLKQSEIIRTRKKISYYNLPCSFDIETSSFYKQSKRLDEIEKQAIMYEWTISLNGYVFIGRTYEELLTFFNKLENELKLRTDKRIIIYVHNLGYEFQFIRKYFKWLSIFSLDDRKPIQAITLSGIEFRCSYLLSGYKLETVAKNLQKYKIEKMVGDLDYNLIRHSTTPLTEKELGYCINDVQIVVNYIKELIEQWGDITKLPLTKTGFVRQLCRNACLPQNDKKKYQQYKKFIHSLNLTKVEYLQLQRAFAGGFTHANPLYSGETMNNVDSFDFTSSYPYVAISEKFPMSSAKIVNPETLEEFKHYLNTYCCLFDIEFIELKPKVLFDNYISRSKCFKIEGYIENNGRIVEAKLLRTTITEQDFRIIEAMYSWNEIRVNNFRIYRKGYLPTELVQVILKKYNDKTILKGVIGKETEYLNSKENVNSIYGMMVTDICRDENIYNDEWSKAPANIDECITRYNNSTKRFLFYPWGVWITAYARRNLFWGILNFREDYVYADTDSCKILNKSKHMDFINYYNQMVENKLLKAMKYHNIPFKLTKPKNIKGEECKIGVWDFDGHYDKFKTLGAKRYMYMHKASDSERKLYPHQIYNDNFYNITVSGLRKDICVPYLLTEYGENIFNKFNEDLYIPADYTGKNTHTYLDKNQSGVITDYLGNNYIYNELSSIHLEKCDYSLSLSDAYIQFLFNIKNYSK